MRYMVCSVRDIVADVYNLPYAAQSRGQVVRSFTDEVNRAADDNLLYKHSDDYELFQVGWFESDSGMVESLASPISLMTGRDAKVPESVVPKIRGVN